MGGDGLTISKEAKDIREERGLMRFFLFFLFLLDRKAVSEQRRSASKINIQFFLALHRRDRDTEFDVSKLEW